MTNEELQAIINETRDGLYDCWFWQRRRKKVWQHQLEFFLKVQRDRASAAPAEYPDAIYKDAQGEPIRPPQCIHGKLMPTKHSAGEPCEPCERNSGPLFPSAGTRLVPGVNCLPLDAVSPFHDGAVIGSREPPTCGASGQFGICGLPWGHTGPHSGDPGDPPTRTYGRY